MLRRRFKGDWGEWHGRKRPRTRCSRYDRLLALPKDSNMLNLQFPLVTHNVFVDVVLVLIPENFVQIILV